MITPRLVDHELFKPKPKVVKIIPSKTPFEKKQDLSMYVNIFFVLVIIIFCLILYYRKEDKEDYEMKKKESIFNLYNYVTQEKK